MVAHGSRHGQRRRQRWWLCAAAILSSAWSGSGAAEVSVSSELVPARLDAPAAIVVPGVSGVGEVNVAVRRDGVALVLKAIGPKGRVLGEAHSFIGLHESEVYVQTPSGLERIVIRWDSGPVPKPAP